MKKLFLLLVCTLLCSYSFADDIDLRRRPKPSGDNRDLVLDPTASYNEGTVTIYAPYYIDSMTVVIADINEDEIYTVQLGGFTGQQSIILPADVDANKYSLYLYFNGICLYGLF